MPGSGAGSRAARALRPRPVRVEPGRGAAVLVAAGPGQRAVTSGADAAARGGQGRRAVAAGGVILGPAAGPAGLRHGDGRVLRPAEPGRETVVPVPARHAGVRDPGRQDPPAQPEPRGGVRPETRLGPVPAVPRPARRSRHGPRHLRPVRPLACRVPRPAARDQPPAGRCRRRYRPGGPRGAGHLRRAALPGAADQRPPSRPVPGAAAAPGSGRRPAGRWPRSP